MNKLQIFKLNEKAVIPTRSNKTDAGLDLYALEDVFIQIGQTAKVKTGIALNVPVGYVGKIEDRSGMASKGLRTGGGVIDANFSGDVTIVIHNISHNMFVKETENLYFDRMEFGYKIKAGDKIAQVLLYQVATPEVEVVEELWNSERGNKGFASSGW